MKKAILIGIIIIVVVIIGSFITYNQFNNQNNDTVKIDETEFKIPNGFYEGTSNKSVNANLTNGTNSICIIQYSDTDIQKHINDYIEANKNRNYTTEISNSTVDNINIYKSSIINNSDTHHYWFIKHDKVYNVFTHDANNKTEDIILKLIESTNSS